MISKNKFSFCVQNPFGNMIIDNEYIWHMENTFPILDNIYNENLVKSPKKQDIDEKVYKYRRTINGRSSELTIPYTDMLKESLLRSLYREANKWYIYNYQL